MTAWISALSLATLAVVAAITGYLGWRRSTLFRESYYSLSIELTQERIWADESRTLLALTAKLKNTSKVLVRIESAEWSLGLLEPNFPGTLELFASSDYRVGYNDFLLEPQEEDVVFREVWLPTPESPLPAYAQLVVSCPRYNRTDSRGWSRRIHFVLESYDG